MLPEQPARNLFKNQFNKVYHWTKKKIHNILNNYREGFGGGGTGGTTTIINDSDSLREFLNDFEFGKQQSWNGNFLS